MPSSLLESRDGLGQGRLGDHQLIGGLAETAVIDHGEEKLQLPDIHEHPR